MSVLQRALKAAKNPYASIARDGLICGDITGYVGTGVFVLNALISGKLDGGFPKGRVTALAGEKGTGKTFILLKALKEYLDADIENEVIFFESEGAITKDLLEERGLDTERVAIFPVATVEELRNQALVILEDLEVEWNKTKEYPKVTFCLDSLGMLGTLHEFETARTNDNKADMGKRAQLIKSVFRTITLKLSLLQIAMVITNHTYKGMGKYDPTKMSGGQGLEFAASIIIFLSKSGVKEGGKESESGSEKIKNLVGNNITFIVHKGRMTIEGSRAVVGLDFKGGIGRFNGLVEWFVAAGVFKKAGSWYSYGTDRLGQGEKQVYAILPSIISEELISELQPFVEQKFCYGVYSDNVEYTPDDETEEDIPDGE